MRQKGCCRVKEEGKSIPGRADQWCGNVRLPEEGDAVVAGDLKNSRCPVRALGID